MRHQAADDHGLDAARLELRFQIGAGEDAHRVLLQQRMRRCRAHASNQFNALTAFGKHRCSGRIDVLDVDHLHAVVIGHAHQLLRIGQRGGAIGDLQLAGVVLVLEIDHQQRRGAGFKLLRGTRTTQGAQGRCIAGRGIGDGQGHAGNQGKNQGLHGLTSTG
ncbi:hypothetical protein D3C81_1355500 [compost metagenome]